MADQHPVVGPEGLGANTQSLASQISSVEKQLTIRIDASERYDAAQWSAHRDMHEQESEARHVALGTMSHRLDSMNEFRAQMGDMAKTLATQEMVRSLVERMDRFELDTRRRFEQMDANLRLESRPGQDMKTGQVAIVAAISIAAVILGVALALGNFLASH